MEIGIVGYGAYIPRYRITVQELAQAHSKDYARVFASIAVTEKSVPARDEDSTTLAVCAAQNAIKRAGIEGREINALFVGSESAVYAVKPTATIVGQALNMNSFSAGADIEFACKAGTTALAVCVSMVKSEMAKFGMAIGTDVALGASGDILEFGAGSGAASIIVGMDSSKIMATIQDYVSTMSDTPDFWRRSIQRYPQHVGRFTAEPAYFKNVCMVTQCILERNKLTAQDLDYVVFHQPNGKFPLIAAKMLGFTKYQLADGLLVDKIGNTYSACALLGLTSVLDVAEADQKILVVSYGSGGGSDAFLLRTTQNIKRCDGNVIKTKTLIENKSYLSYIEYRENLDAVI